MTPWLRPITLPLNTQMKHGILRPIYGMSIALSNAEINGVSLL
jgi:hypothetical protein